MKKAILSFLRRALGVNQLNERFDKLESCLRGISLGKHFANDLEILPGTEYSRYAVPLDYQPSRAFNPRYGYSHEKIQQLCDFFEKNNAEYLNFISYMKSLDVKDISVNLNDNSKLVPAWIGGAICAFDSLALYAMVMKYKPSIYLEIGSGMTTCFANQAVRDANLSTKIISIDPQPRREVDEICDEVIRDGLETCNLEIFDELKAGDILFFDGSHRSFMNSDVTVFFLDVLPRIKPGVVIHVHDILLPWDYPDSFKYWYWNEQYLMAIYLMTSEDKVHPLLPTAWICRDAFFEQSMSEGFIDLGGDSNLSWRGGGSMWFTKK